jgi:hypothetical protein
MRHKARGLMMSPWFGALLALPTLGIIMPTAATAGCSTHFVVSGARVDGELAQLQRLAEAGAIDENRDQAPHHRPAPCSGVLCSGNPASPLPSQPSFSSSVDKRWAIPSLPIILDGPVSLHGLPGDDALRPVEESSSIFHPPRARANISSSRRTAVSDPR